MDIFWKFLAESSIGGFSQISDSRGKPAKAFWILVVIFSWVAAGKLVSEAFMDWADDPIETTTGTSPISKIKFPSIVVCPPKGVLSFNLIGVNLDHYNTSLNKHKIWA